MAEFMISGVWKDINTSEVTHYAIHQVMERTILKAEKKSKAEVIALLEIKDNSGSTWIWNYQKAAWTVGEEIEIARGLRGKYLRCINGNELTNNLAHLINIDWLE